MEGKTLTKFVLIGVVAFLLLYDFIALHCYGEPATITFVAYEFGSRHPIITFLCGVVFGHVWWPHTARS